MHIKIATIMLVASILGIGAIVPVTYAQSQSSSSMSGAFAEITTTQEGDTITITITRAEGAAPEGGGGEIPEVPEGPIIIIPDPSGEGNGTVIVPEPPANITAPEGGGFETPVAEEPPVIVVEPEGNATAVTPPSNVTVIDNSTVVVAPPDQEVTETPGNVTVIDPPAAVPEPEPCQCPPVGVEGGAPDIQAPGANITMENQTTIIRPDTEPGEESGNGNGNGNGGG